MAKQYKVEVICEGGCGTILMGAAALPVELINTELNRNAAQGWDMHFMVLEQRRYLLFWKREAAVITYVKGV